MISGSIFQNMRQNCANIGHQSIRWAAFDMNIAGPNRLRRPTRVQTLYINDSFERGDVSLLKRVFPSTYACFQIVRHSIGVGHVCFTCDAPFTIVVRMYVSAFIEGRMENAFLKHVKYVLQKLTPNLGAIRWYFPRQQTMLR